MPTYTYQCPDCGTHFEKIGIKVKDCDQHQPCPKCMQLSKRTSESVKSVGIKVKWGG